MVVDLVRNDLSKVCLPGSVRVEELYGIYPFPQVFQMISTVKGALSPGSALDGGDPRDFSDGVDDRRAQEPGRRADRSI